MHPEYNGDPIPILSHPAEWSRAPRVSYHEQTEIVEALSTAEDRFIGRPRPLIHLRYTVQPDSARELGYLRKTIELAKAAPVGVPLWTELRRLTAAAAIGATAIEHTSREFLSYEGMHYLVMTDAFTWEVVRGILDFGFEILNLEEALEKAWPAGAAIVPLLFGYLNRPGARALTDEAGSLEIEFEERFSALPVVFPELYLDLGDGETGLDLGDGETELRLL